MQKLLAQDAPHEQGSPAHGHRDTSALSSHGYLHPLPAGQVPCGVCGAEWGSALALGVHSADAVGF